MARDSLTPSLSPSALAVQTICEDVLLEKYAKAGEVCAADVYARVVRGLASVEAPQLQAHYAQAFFDNMLRGAIGAGCIMSAAGTEIQATLINYFVQPVGDCTQGFDMRKVAWDRGPFRLGTKTKDNGTQVPMWHDSEVAAVAYAIEQIIARRNLSSSAATGFESEQPETTLEASIHSAPMQGKKCSECGAHAMIKKDGCEYCTQCGYIGSCG